MLEYLSGFDMETLLGTDKDVYNNIRGVQLENMGNIAEAVKLYEENVQNRFEGNHPYDRLAVIYRRERNYDDEIRVLRIGVEVFTNLKNITNRKEFDDKLNKFQNRLMKAEELRAK